MQMIDVIQKLREIEERSPEVTAALDSATRMTAKRVDEGVQITVSGSDAVLHQILKLAGLIGAETMEEGGESHDEQRPYQHSMGDDTFGASTSPDEVVLDFDTAVPSGSDMHGLGADGYNKVAGGGNPMRPKF